MLKEINTNLAILPKETIMTALNINEKTLCCYEKNGTIKPEIKNNKPYYSIDDLDKLRKMLNL